MGKKTLIEKVLEPETRRQRKPSTGRLPKLVAALGRVPPITVVHPWFRPDLTDMRWIPVNEDLLLPENVPAPLALLDRLIEEASHRVIFNACGCRTAFQCENHPTDIACLMMGDSALETSPSLRREVGVTEAKEHARKAVEAGLVPMVGKARVDNYIFGVKDRSRLLSTCFCCDCCCISRYERYFSKGRLSEMFPRLNGVHVEVGPACDGCGDCVAHCYVRAIKMKGGKAVISEKCRACGRCAAMCPPRAITVAIDDGSFLDTDYERILACVRHY